MTSPLVKPTVTLAALSSACRPQILSWDWADWTMKSASHYRLQGAVDKGDGAPKLGRENK